MDNQLIQQAFIYFFFLLSFFFISLFFYSIRKRKLLYLLYFGLFTIFMSINLLGVSQLEGSPFETLFKYLSFGASTLFILFYEQIFGKGYQTLNTRIWQLHLIVWVFMILLDVISLIQIELLYLPYSLLNIVTVIYIAVTTVLKAAKGNRDAKIFTFGLIALVLTLIIDISIAMQVHDYAPTQTTTWGLLLFTCCLSIILLKHYREQGSDFFYEPLSFNNNPLLLKMRADSFVMHTLKNETQRLMYLNERYKRNINILDAEVKSKFSETVAAMDEAIHHMADMIDAVKKTDDIKLHFQSVNLQTFIIECVDMIKIGNVPHYISIKVNCKEDIETHLDPLHMKEALLNVLSNSVEAIDHINGKIEIIVQKRNKEVIIEVHDNGHGIPKENMDDILTPLFTTKKTSNNYGVGLYYTFFVIKQHGGSFSIPFSEVGKGTTIKINLPFQNRRKRIIG